MISLEQLTKRHGRLAAVIDVTAQIPDGAVTAFVGPNGAGKTTTMRMIAGLDRPTSGRALVGGKPLREVREPLRTLGVVFDGRAALDSRRGVDHLRWIAAANRLPRSRISATLHQCGIDGVGRRRAGKLSLGMYQRLAIAAALLGDPGVLVLDEPTNGLDPEGMVWMRQLLRQLADDGRTVFISSHLMGELAHIADRVLVIGGGKVLADCPAAELPARAGLRQAVRAQSSDPHRLAHVLRDALGVSVTIDADTVVVRDAATADVAAVAASAGLQLTELGAVSPSLEQAYLALTAEETQYRATVDA